MKYSFAAALVVFAYTALQVAAAPTVVGDVGVIGMFFTNCGFLSVKCFRLTIRLKGISKREPEEKREPEQAHGFPQWSTWLHHGLVLDSLFTLLFILQSPGRLLRLATWTRSVSKSTDSLNGVRVI
jgi:hypothetical protein